LYLEHRSAVVANIKQTERIGIKVGNERPWRFYDEDSKAVSKQR